jgi:phage/plasmid-associated DNA primase
MNKYVLSDTETITSDNDLIVSSKCQWEIGTINECMFNATIGIYCKYCEPIAKRRLKQITDRQLKQVADKQSSCLLDLNKLSLDLIKSSFDDTTIIEFFLKRFNKYKSYDGVIYCFNGSHWVKGSTQYIINDIDLMYRDLYKLIQTNYKDEELLKYLKKILSLRSIKYKENLIKGIIGYVQVEKDLWDLNDDLLGFRNGVYDLARNKFRAGMYEDYITMVIDYDYEKSPKEHLLWVEDYFKKIMPVVAERELLLLLLATTLGGRHLEKFIVCTGSGRNGKDTTFTMLMSRVLGPYYYNCNPAAFTQKIKSDQNVSVANFDKMRAVVTTEPDKDETIKTSLIKSITGADQTAMRTLYSTKTKVNLNETLFMLCNDKPLLDRSEQAMLERLIIIPFRISFKTAAFMAENGLVEGENNVYTANEQMKDHTYLDQMRLRTFNYLLPYYRKFRKDGYLIQSIPESIRKLNESYMEESDEFMNWFNSEYEKTTEKTDIVKLSDVFKNYCQSDFYINLTKKEKRANNKTKFIEKVSTNVSLKIFYKECHQPMIDGKRICMRNVLTNYKVRQEDNS